YTFDVDGTTVVDPSYPPWDSDATMSQVFVPAANDPAGAFRFDPWLSPTNGIAHGTLQHHLIDVPNATGSFAGGKDPVSVYLPPGYKANCRVSYPTLYMVHGAGGNEDDWSTQGYGGI